MSDEVAGWVWDTNVRKLMEYLSLWTAYDFDESDWQAIETALPNTDADASNGWYEYPLGGCPGLSVQLASNPGRWPG
jgi:hypothetical protein